MLPHSLVLAGRGQGAYDPQCTGSPQSDQGTGPNDPKLSLPNESTRAENYWKTNIHGKPFLREIILMNAQHNFRILMYFLCFLSLTLVPTSINSAFIHMPNIRAYL